MVAPVDAYPLSTQDGKQIRLDVIKPIKLVVVPFSTAAFAALDITTLQVDHIYEISSTQACVLGFGVTPLAAMSSGNNLYLPARVSKVISPPINLMGLSVIGALVGDLYIQEVVSWAGLANPASTIRG